MLHGHDIICISGIYWDALWLSAHQYISRLARDNRVLFVERPITPLSLVASGQRGYVGEQIRAWREGSVRHAGDNLYIAAPPPALPLRYEQPIIQFNQIRRRRWVRRVAQQMGFTSPLLWIYDPDAALMVGHMGEKLALYAITDDHPTRAVSLNRVAAMRHWENELLRRCDLAIASAENLADMKKSVNPHTYYIPHGVDSDHFAQALDPAYPEAPEMVSYPRPIIGFVGQINYRMNTDILIHAAQHHPEWSFVFIGPVRSAPKGISLDKAGVDDRLVQLEALPNVHFIGKREREALPGYIKAFSVGIIPFLINEHTTYMHPLKTLEYLAAGKPVVATSMPALQIYREHVTFADEPETFTAALETAITRSAPAQQQAYATYGRQNNWESRLETISDLIEQHLNRPT